MKIRLLCMFAVILLINTWNILGTILRKYSMTFWLEYFASEVTWKTVWKPIAFKADLFTVKSVIIIESLSTHFSKGWRILINFLLKLLSSCEIFQNFFDYFEIKILVLFFLKTYRMRFNCFETNQFIIVIHDT